MTWGNYLQRGTQFHYCWWAKQGRHPPRSAQTAEIIRHQFTNVLLWPSSSRRDISLLFQLQSIWSYIMIWMLSPSKVSDSLISRCKEGCFYPFDNALSFMVHLYPLRTSECMFLSRILSEIRSSRDPYKARGQCLHVNQKNVKLDFSWVWWSGEVRI